MSSVVAAVEKAVSLPLIMAHKAALGDARRQENVHSFVRESVEDSYGAADLYSTLSLIMGLISFTLKVSTA